MHNVTLIWQISITRYEAFKMNHMDKSNKEAWWNLTSLTDLFIEFAKVITCVNFFYKFL